MNHTLSKTLQTAPLLLFLSLGIEVSAQQGPPPGPEPPPKVQRGREPLPPQRVSGISLPMERHPDRLLPALKQRAVSVRILARILSAADEELWAAECDKVTIPGRPVALRLIGTNLAVVVQFTPYSRGDKRWVLVAQGQIWLEDGENGLRYETTLQTIPVKIGEQVYYFPLGSNRADGGDTIELCLELRPYHDKKGQDDEEQEKQQE